MSDVDRVPQVELFGEGGEIVGVSVHLISIPGLGGTAVPTPVMGDDPITPLAEEQHLPVPVVRGEGPAMAENDRLSRTPVFVINLRTVFRTECGHSSLLW